MTLSLHDIHEDILRPTAPPGKLYRLLMVLLAGGVAMLISTWIYQVRTGMGVAGINQPVGWAVYITNFVFWVGIGHAGTLVSAILHLVRSRWRTSIARAAEAMTVFAVMTAGLFPLIHLGRLWVFYYIIPYPSERQLWPDFVSPLVWDVCAITTYLIVSTVFWLVGLIPDAASARDRAARLLGPDHMRTKLYGLFAQGWTGASSQWGHYGRAYLYFAALATPLVISVHSVVSWDFAMSNLPGWHTTIFAPYFVAGAIHSGLAMVLTLLIPLRKLLRLERVITMDHFAAIATTLLVTGVIVGYAYAVEPFIAWYSQDKFEAAFSAWRAAGSIAPFYWALFLLNVLAPLAFLFRKARRSAATLFTVGILINVGMWLERWVIITGSLSHDFLPHTWHGYGPRWPEVLITVGSFCFFLFWFCGFAKLLPTVGAADVKELAAGLLHKEIESPRGGRRLGRPRRKDGGVLAVFGSVDALVSAVRKVREAPFDRAEAYSPFKIDGLCELLHGGRHPVRYWTLAGALCGLVGGFWLAIGSAAVNDLWAGGKLTTEAITPYCIVAFEGTILLGALANLVGMVVHTRIGGLALPAGFDRRFTEDRFGVFLACEASRREEARALLDSCGPQEVRVVD